MRLKNFIFGLMALLAMATSIQQPLFADKKHSSSSSCHKDDKCCKKSKKLLKQINQTTKQDLVVDQTTLNVVNQINQTTRTDLAVDQETLEIVKHLEDCSCTCTVIMPEDFADEEGGLTQTYFITEPGSYCLGADVAFAPVYEFTAAINILANDVRLDLRGFTLSQDNDTPNAYGVQIGEGYFYNDPDAVLKNITVENGSIINFTAIGVFCYNGSFDEPTAEHAFEDLHFFDLNVLDCGSSPSFDFASGIDLDSFADTTLFDPATRVGFKNVIIENCNVNRCLGNAAIQIYTADNLVVSKTQANDLSTTVDVFNTLAHAYYVRNLQMYNCQGNGTTDLDSVNIGSVTGIFLGECINVELKECQFNDTFGDSTVQTYAGNFPNLQSAIFENCQFNNSRGGKNAKIMSGVRIGAASGGQETQANGIRFINCQFNGTTVDSNAPVANPAYFSINCGVLMQTTRNISFENCQACNIHTDNTNYHAFGYFVVADLQGVSPFFGNAQNVTFKNCIASDITTAGKDAVGFFTGSLDLNFTAEQGQLINVVVENCIAERIYSDSATHVVAGIAEGLYPAEGLFETEFAVNNNLFVNNCRVSDVRSHSEGAPSPLSAGIVIQAVNRPVITSNSVSDCDRGILLTGTDLIFPNNFFQLAASEEDALAFPPVFIDLTSRPASSPAQTFTNTVAGRGGPVSINPSTSSIDLGRDYILSTPTNLNFSGGATRWQPGDTILYNNGGGTNIGGLVSGTTYYLIVYIPGFSEKGLIQNNQVDNCSISCYQDDAPTTSSAWVNNTAFNCGAVPTQFTNYDIDFAGVRPVDAGTLVAYPVGGNKYYNLSLIP